MTSYSENNVSEAKLPIKELITKAANESPSLGGLLFLTVVTWVLAGFTYFT